MSDRLTRLREKMAEHKLDGFFVSAPAEDIFHTSARTGATSPGSPARWASC